MSTFIMSCQKLGSDVVIEDKIVHCNRIENVIAALKRHGYHAFEYHEAAPKEDIVKVEIGGYNHETEQGREVC
jgi:hypothetical protein